MSETLLSSETRRDATSSVRPSQVRPETPFTLEQELEPFGRWVDKPIWVPPKDRARALAQTMFEKYGPFSRRDTRWLRVFKKHRSEFTQVREIELPKASIRLPEGRFFVTVTERKDFDKITDTIPACVQTRLDEFLADRGQDPRVKVSYLKPLCVEVGDELILTTREDLMAAIDQVKAEAFAAYRRLCLWGVPKRVALATLNTILAVPRAIADAYTERRRKAIETYHARLEFKRRQTALEAAKTHRKCRTAGCTYEEMLELTSPLDTGDVIEQYGIEHDLSRAELDRIRQIAAGTLPWFMALSIGAVYLTSVSVAATAPPVMVCDPAFVAELPEAPGVLLKIGHFDEIAGVTHVEI